MTKNNSEVVINDYICLEFDGSGLGEEELESCCGLRII